MNGRNERGGADAPELVVQDVGSAPVATAEFGGESTPSRLDTALLRAAAAEAARQPDKKAQLAQAIRRGDMGEARKLVSAVDGLNQARQFLGVTLQIEGASQELVDGATMHFIRQLDSSNVQQWIHDLSVSLPLLWQKNQRMWLKRLYEMALGAALAHGDFTYCDRLVASLDQNKGADNPIEYGFTSEVIVAMRKDMRKKTRKFSPAPRAVAKAAASTVELPVMDPPAATEFGDDESPSARYMQRAKQADTPAEAKQALTQAALAEKVEQLRSQALACRDANEAKEILAEANRLEQGIKNIPKEREV